MYSVDINFLNDRAERQSELVKSPRSSGGGNRPRPSGDKTPLYIGLGLAIAALAGVGGFWGFLKSQERSLMAKQAELDAQLVVLQQKLAQVETIKLQTQAARDESQALAMVFEKIRPWSAIVKDVQNRIPTRTQITSIGQTAGEAIAPPDGSAAVVPPAGGLSIQGTACSFDDVNDFVLTLKNSPFLEGPTVKLGTSSLGGEALGRCPGDPAREEPVELVSYTIAGNVKSIPAAELLAELDRQQEATGLASRIKALQETGAIE
jgi:type IV pilus assembly protein PilN